MVSVVSGEAYRAVPRKQIEMHVASLPRLVDLASHFGLMPHHFHVAKGIKERVKQAAAFGRQFGLEFEMPMAICFLASQGKTSVSTEGELHASVIEALTIPRAWTTDSSFPTSAGRLLVSCTRRELPARRWPR